MNLVRFYELLSCPFRIYLRSWESENVLAYEIFLFLQLKPKKKKGYNFEFKFSSIQPMCQCQPPSALPHSCPLKCSLWHSLSCCRWSSEVPHSQRQVEQWGYCEDNFRLEYRPKTKTGSAWNCLAVPILSLGFTWKTLLQDLPTWQTTMTFYTKRNAKWRQSLSIFAKPCTRGYVNGNKSAGWGNRALM